MKLSATMQGAIEHAKANGGVLKRYPCGFWMKPGIETPANDTPANVWANNIWYGTETIRALIKREQVMVTGWRRNASGDFPVEVTVKDFQK